MSYVDTPNQPPQVLSLCSGMCGLERGIERAIGKLNVVAYVEIEAFIIQNLTALMEQGILDPAPVWSDLKTFPSAAFHNKLHGIIGGYPCQPFSVAGKQKGSADPRHLWPHIQRIIEATNPIWCFFENVAGHLQLGFDEVYRSLADMGYTVEAGIFTAQEVGAPHQRERLFILAVADSYINTVQKREIFPWLWSESERASNKQLANSRHTEQQGRQAPAQRVHGQQTQPEPAPCCLSGKYKLAYTENQRELSRSREFEEHGGSREQLERARKGSNIIDSNTNVAYTNVPGFWRINKGRPQPKTERSGENVSHSSSNGLQGFGQNGSWQGSTGLCGRTQNSEGCHPELVEGWPLGPGPYQQPWEAPRTIESGMGSTAHGYNFREDLLRMYGNGVVEQSSELAWITLWKKIEHITTKN